MSNNFESSLPGLSEGLAELIERAGGAVVAVQSAPYRVVSGVVLRENLIAVANHSLKREGHIPVQLADGSQVKTTIVGRDGSLDVALLKLEGSKLTPPPHAHLDSLKAGSLALIVGRTMDVGLSASLGIFGAVGPTRRTWRGGTLDRFLRLDVNLYPSQSGAAVIDASGGLVGLATPALLRHSAVAVPVTTLNRVADELLQHGHIKQGYLGIGLHPVAIPEHLRAKLTGAGEHGLMLITVEPGGPAEKAGLQLGDILATIDGQAITDTEEVMAILRNNAVGRKLTINFLRGGEPMQADVDIAEQARRRN